MLSLVVDTVDANKLLVLCNIVSYERRETCIHRPMHGVEDSSIITDQVQNTKPVSMAICAAHLNLSNALIGVQIDGPSLRMVTIGVLVEGRSITIGEGALERGEVAVEVTIILVADRSKSHITIQLVKLLLSGPLKVDIRILVIIAPNRSLPQRPLNHTTLT